MRSGYRLEAPKVSNTGDFPVSAASGSSLLMRKSQNIVKKRIKLLLVDDEKRFVKVLAKRLGRRNIDVTTTFSGTEAIQALRKVDFDVADFRSKNGRYERIGSAKNI